MLFLYLSLVKTIQISSESVDEILTGDDSNEKLTYAVQAKGVVTFKPKEEFLKCDH